MWDAMFALFSHPKKLTRKMITLKSIHKKARYERAEAICTDMRDYIARTRERCHQRSKDIREVFIISHYSL
jgi:hypothetical protein